MGQVYVIRKEAAVAVPSGVPGMQIMYQPGMENRGPQLVQGVNPQGLAGLQTNPITQQFEAKPQMDDSGKNEIGVYEGDKYGARSLNINPKFNQNLAFGPVTAEQAPIQEAQKKVFERGAKYGQRGANVGRGLAAGIGVLAGAVTLANAGAAGQDAVTGGLGAAQMGCVTYQQGKKPLSEAGGEIGAQIGARGVKVETPQVADPTPQVAEPTPTHTEDEMINMRGKVPVMTKDKHGLDVEFGARANNPGARARAQGGSNLRVNQNIGRDTSVDTNYSPVDHMGMPTAVGVEETGMVTGGGAQSTFPTGTQQGDEVAQAAANKVKVAPATTNTSEPTAATSGAAIADATTGQPKLVGIENTANEIKDATNPKPAEGSDPENPAAKEMSGKEQKMTKLASSNPMRFIGVV